MAALSRDKGQRGEREAAAVLSELTGGAVARLVRQYGGDADLTGLENWGAGWCVEVKRLANCPPATLAQHWCQAVQQAQKAQLVPLLMVRLDRGDWLCYWPAALHTGTGSIYSTSLADTLRATPVTWCAMVQKLPCQHVKTGKF